MVNPSSPAGRSGNRTFTLRIIGWPTPLQTPYTDATETRPLAAPAATLAMSSRREGSRSSPLPLIQPASQVAPRTRSRPSRTKKSIIITPSQV